MLLPATSAVISKDGVVKPGRGLSVDPVSTMGVARPVGGTVAITAGLTRGVSAASGSSVAAVPGLGATAALLDISRLSRSIVAGVASEDRIWTEELVDSGKCSGVVESMGTSVVSCETHDDAIIPKQKRADITDKALVFFNHVQPGGHYRSLTRTGLSGRNY